MFAVIQSIFICVALFIHGNATQSALHGQNKYKRKKKTLKKQTQEMLL